MQTTLKLNFRGVYVNVHSIFYKTFVLKVRWPFAYSVEKAVLCKAEKVVMQTTLELNFRGVTVYVNVHSIFYKAFV